MKQVVIKKGEAHVEEVPTPVVGYNMVMVKVYNSCISVGTELSSLKMTSLPLWKRAIKQPENVKKVFNSISEIGISKTKELVLGKLDSGNVTGYSAAGIVVDVGDNIKDFKVGDKVACAGAEYANHADYINVPENLVVKIPESVSFRDASSVTLGAISMQGIRRLNPTIGETFVIVGLGILGQLTNQILRANGCKTIGLDLEKNRIDMAKNSGLSFSIDTNEPDVENHVSRLTNGYGADGVIITAATASSELISDAFKMTRKKGRVVIVGDVGLNLNRADIYKKELDVLISCSYGPGRYDSMYEEKGLEYPLPYVRWTENRNMISYLELIRSNSVNLEKLNCRTYKIDDAKLAYSDLKKNDRPLVSFLRFSENIESSKSPTVLELVKSINFKSKLNIALIGAGGFAKGMHLPNLTSLKNDFNLGMIVSKSGHNAKSTGVRYGFEKVSTNYIDALNDTNIDTLLISTRHSLHYKMTIDSLKAGKNVFVEKPLVLNLKELESIKDFYKGNTNSKPILFVGYNRRFSSYARKIKSHLENRSNPIIINYVMNAGYIPLDHWVHGEEGGGRNIGEACHIYDLFTYLIGCKYTSINAKSINPATNHYSKTDNFTTTIYFEDGSIANLIYTALGNKKYSKEKMEVFFDGKVIVLDNYQNLSFFGLNEKEIKTTTPEKGQKDELIQFKRSVKANKFPIKLWELYQVSEISFEVEKQINK